MLKRLIMAIQSLTCIHILNVSWEEEQFGRSSAFFSLVGLFIGGLLWSVKELTGQFYPPTVVAGLLVFAEIVITGGMHLDGFMDSMDGLFCGRPRERKLEIMRDSRVGAYGVMAVIMLILIKYLLLMELPITKQMSLLIMPAMARWAVVYCFLRFPYARPEGLGKAYQKHAKPIDMFCSLLFVVVAAYLLFGVIGLFLTIAITFIANLLGRQISLVLGGLTGDTYGAIIELSEVAFLLIVFLF